MRGLFTAVASLMEHRLEGLAQASAAAVQGLGGCFRAPGSTGLIVVAVDLVQAVRVGSC